MFVDYVFNLLPDGSIMMDNELKPTLLNVKDGDRFVVRINDKGNVFFQKQEDELKDTKPNLQLVGAEI